MLAAMPLIDLCKLISAALNSSAPASGLFPGDVDWNEVMNLAINHGLAAIAFDGLRKALDSAPELRSGVPTPVLMQWYGQTVQQEGIFRKHWEAACALSSLLSEYGIEPIVLKGRAIAQYYPTPEHRYSCDLDLFVQGGDWARACGIFEERGVSLEREVYKEVEFKYMGVHVELHRFITPVRGNKTLSRFENYLLNMLEHHRAVSADGGTAIPDSRPVSSFDGTSLRNPPLMFTVMLSIEHALGDLLHGKFSLKHVVDWAVLRKQDINPEEVEARCRDFGFERFLTLIDALADVLEGKKPMESLPPSDREVMDSFFTHHAASKEGRSNRQDLSMAGTSAHQTPLVVGQGNCQTPSVAGLGWFAKRVSLFFSIIRNRRYFKAYGYCPMSRFLLAAVFSHFFNRHFDKH